MKLKHTFNVTIEIPQELEAEYNAMMNRYGSDMIDDELEDMALTALRVMARTSHKSLAKLLIDSSNAMLDRMTTV